MPSPYEDRPSGELRAITPDDDNDLPGGETRAIYVGGDGNIVVVDSTGTQSTLVGAVAGSILPVKVRRVRSTSTTAANLVAMY